MRTPGACPDRRGGGRRWGVASLRLAFVGVAVLAPCARGRADGPPTPAYDVALDGAAAFRSVQAAVDAAGPGATIRIGPGTFEGAVVVRRPVTLVGAGPDATLLVADVTFDRDAAKAAKDRAAGVRATLRIEGHGFLTLRDLALSGRAPEHSGSFVVSAVAAELWMTHCAIVNTQASALLVGPKAKLTLEGCLVAAIGSDGVVVDGGVASLDGCDVRDVRHYGVAIGAGSRATVARCRISGSLWHGIRYDDASPTIRGNRIAGNARSGIYASGATQAVVEDNVFVDNGMSGISCWFACADTIRRNTFVDGKREAIAVLGGSHPTIEANVIVGHPTAILGAHTSGERPEAKFVGPLRLTGNVLWKNAAIAAAPPPAGSTAPFAPVEVPWQDLAAQKNVQVDPGFADAAAGDFALPEGSAARAAGAGVLAPLSAASPWPPRPEEAAWKEALARERSPTPAPLPTRPPGPVAPTAYEIAKPWVEGLHSFTDAARRDVAVAAIRAALQGEDPLRHHAAFKALAQSADVAWDRAALGPDVRRRLAGAQGEAEVSGFYALQATGLGPDDLALLLKALEHPSSAMTERGSHLLFVYTNGEIAGPAAEAVLRLLSTGDGATVREVCRGLWGAHVSPEVEARLLALADPKDPQRYHDVVYFALSTLREKSPAVVAALARAAEDPDPNVSHRAVWGLASGVSSVARKPAADLFLAVFELRSDASQREEALRALADLGDASHATRLEQIAKAPALDPRLRGAVEDTVRRIRARLAR